MPSRSASPPALSSTERPPIGPAAPVNVAVVEAVQEAVVDVGYVMNAHVDPPGHDHRDIDRGSHGEGTPPPPGNHEQREEDGQDDERSLVLRHERAGEAERCERE